MRYDDRVIDEVQSASDIVDVIQQYVPLKRSGRNLKACCPFHQEKTASFMVSPEKQIFHCFGCSAGGNVFGFLMRYENASFPEVLRQLAERAQIRLPEAPSSRAGGEENEQLYEVYKLAAQFYRAVYRHPEKGKVARDYINARHFNEEIQEDFQFGWAPEGWTHLFDALTRKGFKENILIKSGLVHRSAKGRCYDSFRGRIMIPIRNLQGKVVAFGGRVLSGQDGPKYLNSPENPIFHKRKELFGLDKAKRFIDRDHPRIVLVEGYFDFLRLYQSGFQASVATLGTALTEDHVRVLKRFAEEAVVIYDGDAAGQAASLRGLEVFLQGGMNVKLVKMPEGQDPDDFLQKNGPEAMQRTIDEARDFFDFKLDALKRRYPNNDSLALMKITNDFLETFLKIESPVLLSHYLRRLSASLGVDEGSLTKELDKLKNKSRRRPDTAEPVKETETFQATDESLLIALAMDEPEIASRLCEELQESDFTQEWTQAIFGLLSEARSQNKTLNWAQVLSRLQNAAARAQLVAASHIEWTSGSRLKAYEDCLNRLQHKRIDQRKKHLRRQISQAEQEGNMDLLGRYLKEYQSLMKLG